MARIKPGAAEHYPVIIGITRKIDHKIVEVDNLSLERERLLLDKWGNAGYQVTAYVPRTANSGYYILVKQIDKTLDPDAPHLLSKVRKSPTPFVVGSRTKPMGQLPLMRFLHKAILIGGWRINELADETNKRGKCKISKSGINSWLLGTHYPKVNTLQEVLQTLGFGLAICPLPERLKEIEEE